MVLESNIWKYVFHSIDHRLSDSWIAEAEWDKYDC